jgi:hypothetical protein
MLSQEEYNRYWEMVMERLLRDKELRVGQVMYNALYKLNSKVAEGVVGSGNDPFYDDSRIMGFIEYIKPKVK